MQDISISLMIIYLFFPKGNSIYYKQNYIIILWVFQPTWISPLFLYLFCFFLDCLVRKIRAIRVLPTITCLFTIIIAIFAWYFFSLLLSSFRVINSFFYMYLIVRLDRLCCFWSHAFCHQQNLHLFFGRDYQESYSLWPLSFHYALFVTTLSLAESPRFSLNSYAFHRQLKFHKITAHFSISPWAVQRFLESDTLNAL